MVIPLLWGLAGSESDASLPRRFRCNVYGQELVWPCNGGHPSKLVCLIHTLGTSAFTACADLRGSAQLDLLPRPQCWDELAVIELDYLWPAVRSLQAPRPKG
jgi:hypothetical protein